MTKPSRRPPSVDHFERMRARLHERLAGAKAEYDAACVDAIDAERLVAAGDKSTEMLRRLAAVEKRVGRPADLHRRPAATDDVIDERIAAARRQPQIARAQQADRRYANAELRLHAAPLHNLHTP